ncbi:hypothetical protein [Paenarthrobacter nitroguajacolicus]|uniref:hypothetical protein n=1 Tax=Paenarthrobacter nitroguajacolicus TaxID=211146 RepID=UPI00248BAC9D|nr:hypothetical protein [Paenarthrobacter nitroguajacolicus]MDI2037148.1 hypothetical protein [Paenarthrobacter nitroguajacolicus]
MSNTQRTAYELNSIKWEELKSYAAKVAERTRAPRLSAKQVVVRKVPNERRHGFLGLRRETVFEEVRETQVTHEYWVLMSRHWNRERKTQQATEETNERILYCLRSTGELFVRVESSETIIPYTGRAFVTHESTERPFTMSDVYMFDFKPKYYETYGESPKVWTDRDNTDELLVHGKGFGLSLVLRKLL